MTCINFEKYKMRIKTSVLEKAFLSAGVYVLKLKSGDIIKFSEARGVDVVDSIGGEQWIRLLNPCFLLESSSLLSETKSGFYPVVDVAVSNVAWVSETLPLPRYQNEGLQ